MAKQILIEPNVRARGAPPLTLPIEAWGLVDELRVLRVVRQAVIDGMSAIGELERVRAAFDLGAASGATLPEELRPVAVCEEHSKRFAEALNYLELKAQEAESKVFEAVAV